MAISTAMCTSFKVDLFFGRHNFANSGGNTFKLAMYTSSATLGASTTAYGATNEVSVGGGGTGYTAGGGSLTRVDPTSSGTTGYTDFADLVFTLSGASATLAADGCLIYNDTLTTPVADASVSTHAFSGSPSASGDGATFTIQFPTADATNAILRIA
jgi:hypothetical protein